MGHCINTHYYYYNNYYYNYNMGLPLMEMDVWWFWSVSCMIFSRNKLNRMGGRTHIADCSGGHCWSSHIATATGLHARLCQTPSGSLCSCGTDHSGVVHASLWWLLKICSTVPQLSLKPVCSSASSSSALGSSRLRITCSMILRGWLMVW